MASYAGQVDWVIKIGGRALIEEGDGPETLSRLAHDIAQLRKSGLSVAVIHGGGPAINAELTRREITWSFLEGQRVTTPEMMDVIESVLCGSMNRKVVRALQTAGVDALGFSGVDGQTFRCSQFDPRLERVGRIDEVRGKWIGLVASAGGVPVLAPIGSGADGGAFNINADWAAARVAVALGAKRLVFLTDQDGILSPSGSCIGAVGDAGLASLVEDKIVTGGMLAKVQTIRYALAHGVVDVRVANGKRGLIGCDGTACRLDAPTASVLLNDADNVEARA
jgi:acetylglutamate kinase